jgi:hypothetical protein
MQRQDLQQEAMPQVVQRWKVRRPAAVAEEQQQSAVVRKSPEELASSSALELGAIQTLTLEGQSLLAAKWTRM